MLFLPYDKRYIRCHPLAASFVDNDLDVYNLRIKSTRRVNIKCSICDNIINGTIVNLIRQTTQCNNHKKRESKSQRYIGTIPSFVSNAIRAGILMEVESEKLVELIASMEPICKENDSTRIAKEYIKEVALFDPVKLSDNCFWGNDTSTRINKERYKHHKKPKHENGYNDVRLPCKIQVKGMK